MPVEGDGKRFGVVYAGVQFTVAEIVGGVHRFGDIRRQQVLLTW